MIYGDIWWFSMIHGSIWWFSAISMGSRFVKVYEGILEAQLYTCTHTLEEIPLYVRVYPVNTLQ